VNNDGSTQQTTVTIQDSGGDVVFDKTYTLSPGDEENVTTQEDPGDYTLRVSTESTAAGETTETADTTYMLPLVSGDRESFTTIRIQEDGTIDIQTYWQE